MPAPVTSSLITISNGAEGTGSPPSGALAAVYDPLFYQRVGLIAVMIARAVCREDPTTTGHANRASRALQYLGSCSQEAQQIQMAMLVVVDLDITESSTSQQIADKLASLWDTISGD